MNHGWIDAHVHVLGPDSSFPAEYPGLGPDFDLSADALIRDYLDPAGIEQAVLLALDTPDANRAGRFIRQADAMDAARRFPGRFIVFASIDAGAEDRCDQLRRAVECGCRGLGEVKYTDLHDPRHEDLFALCGELGLPVLGHVDPDLSNLERVLQTHPKANFIAHGPEFWAHMKPDEGPATGAGPLERLLDRYGNLYADLSANSGYHALTRNPEYGRRFVRRFSRKLLYATDWPCLRKQELPPERFGENGIHLDLVRDTLGETPERDDVMGGNLRRILE